MRSIHSNACTRFSVYWDITYAFVAVAVPSVGLDTVAWIMPKGSFVTQKTSGLPVSSARQTGKTAHETPRVTGNADANPTGRTRPFREEGRSHQLQAVAVDSGCVFTRR